MNGYSRLRQEKTLLEVLLLYFLMAFISPFLLLLCLQKSI
jgi:hypothetical protein